MVKKKFGFSVADEIMKGTIVYHRSGYSARSAYPKSEFKILLNNHSAKTCIIAGMLMHHFGKFFIKRIIQARHNISERKPDTFGFPENLENFTDPLNASLYTDEVLQA